MSCNASFLLPARRIAWAAALAGLLAAAAPAHATDVGVSIGINQPGVYGRIDIGLPGVNYPELSATTIVSGAVGR